MPLDPPALIDQLPSLKIVPSFVTVLALSWGGRRAALFPASAYEVGGRLRVGRRSPER
ncbi:hypothetical protein ACO9S2_05105 [Nitrospira sp. NS4]|uniref:hypothetical protein n=1 Tax=Nitrospira sp. NS4 TaxID=3414498 RepID=UPI003C2F7D2E